MNPKRDAQKTDNAGLTAEPQSAAGVAKPDSKREGRDPSGQSSSIPKTPVKPRPRQDTLDRERAADEGMPPTSQH